MRILEIIKDIFDDVNHSLDSYTDMYRDMGSTSWDARRNGFDIGFFMTMLPNILGFLLGLALTKMFGMSGAAYPVLGAIGAVGLGVLNSVYRQGIALKYAVIRHVIIVSGIALIYGLVCLIEK
jgi:hypothetical protein